MEVAWLSNLPKPYGQGKEKPGLAPRGSGSRDHTLSFYAPSRGLTEWITAGEQEFASEQTPTGHRPQATGAAEAAER